MSGKWFNNHGQAVQVIAAVVACLVALIANWQAIQAHQDLLAWWPVVIMPLAVLIAFRLGRSSRPTEELKVAAISVPQPTPTEEAPKLYSGPPTYTERFALDDDSLTITKQSVKLGDFWQLGQDLGRLKIAPLSFKTAVRNTSGVEIRFDTQGSMFYGGTETVETGTNTFVLAETSSGFQAEPHCAYQFSFSDRHVHFKVLRVDHINKIGNEVVLEVCTLSLRKVARRDG